MAGKFTVPFATVLFALLGIPLGLKPARGGQSERFGVAISLFFLYYMLMRLGRDAGGARDAQRAGRDGDSRSRVPGACGMDVLRAARPTAPTRAADPAIVLWDLIERFGRKEAA